MQVYELKVLSRPTLALGDTDETASYIVGGPWIVVFDNMVTEDEADRLIEVGGIEGYKRSMDAAGFNPDGSAAQFLSPQRTSTNAWCINECAADPKAKVVSDRISDVTGIPESFAENLQLLHYTEGQFCTYSFAYFARFPVDARPPLTFLHDFLLCFRQDSPRLHSRPRGASSWSSHPDILHLSERYGRRRGRWNTLSLR